MLVQAFWIAVLALAADARPYPAASQGSWIAISVLGRGHHSAIGVLASGLPQHADNSEQLGDGDGASDALASLVGGWHLPRMHVSHSSLAMRCQLTAAGTRCIAVHSTTDKLRGSALPWQQRARSGLEQAEQLASAERGNPDYQAAGHALTAASQSAHPNTLAGGAQFGVLATLPSGFLMQRAAGDVRGNSLAAPRALARLGRVRCLHKLLARSHHGNAAVFAAAMVLSLLWTALLAIVGWCCATLVLRVLRSIARACRERSQEEPGSPDMKGKAVGKAQSNCERTACGRQLQQPLLSSAEHETNFDDGSPAVGSAYLKQ